jgi:signal peptidase I
MTRTKSANKREGTADARQASKDSPPAAKGRATRETVESIAVAVILAFLFRAFVAEAFVIPTGSMAPTLQGRHLDVACSKCGYRYRTGASVENEGRGRIYATTCPICQYTMELRPELDPDQQSFNGDRILVSKFSYEFQDPQRWEVIVFKYPGNAKLNYIKRLVGLPNETLAIRCGDVYCRKHGDGPNAKEHIARKPPRKLVAMLQLVDDTDYRAPELTKIGWPERWQDWRTPEAPAWRRRDGKPGYETAGSAGQEAWLRYRHVIPWSYDWADIRQGHVPERLRIGQVRGQLITDYYAYNDGMTFKLDPRDPIPMRTGQHWVGDLAVECDVQIQGADGELLLDLVEGGVHYQCRIDVATGVALLQIDQGREQFVDESGTTAVRRTAQTPIRGPGSYQLRFSNCDDQLLLWVNNRLALFDGPTTYVPAQPVKPRWSPADPGDLEPAGIGAKGVGLIVPRLRVYRDVYYIATSAATGADCDYERQYGVHEVLEVFCHPEQWATTTLFDDRRMNVQFPLGDGQFFPMGDNSPQSKDARVWSKLEHIWPRADWPPPESPPPYVTRDLLTGKALFIYWPHSWNRPVPFTPNIRRMGLIR